MLYMSIGLTTNYSLMLSPSKLGDGRGNTQIVRGTEINTSLNRDP